RPPAPGPFPAVVIMHGCSGAPGHSEWVKRLNAWGYATYYIDSFTPRHLTNVCVQQQLKGEGRVDDAYAALAYLRTRPDVRADRIGLLGFSHGGIAAAPSARAAPAARGRGPARAAAGASCRSL